MAKKIKKSDAHRQALQIRSLLECYRQGTLSLAALRNALGGGQVVAAVAASIVAELIEAHNARRQHPTCDHRVTATTNAEPNGPAVEPIDIGPNAEQTEPNGPAVEPGFGTVGFAEVGDEMVTLAKFTVDVHESVVDALYGAGGDAYAAFFAAFLQNSIGTVPRG